MPRMRRRGEGVRRLPKLRKVCKWTGLVLSVMLLVVWVGSGWYGLSCKVLSDRLNITFFQHGQFGVTCQNTPIEGFDGVSFGRIGDGPRLFRTFQWGEYAYTTPQGSVIDTVRCVYVPLWLPLLICIASTACPWYCDRRLSKPGLCKQCSYDMRGLEVCPECGVAVKA